MTANANVHPEAHVNANDPGRSSSGTSSPGNSGTPAADIPAAVTTETHTSAETSAVTSPDANDAAPAALKTASGKASTATPPAPPRRNHIHPAIHRAISPDRILQHVKAAQADQIDAERDGQEARCSARLDD